ncbi:MAG: adenylate/guanylate cyclase domain-containing protein [Propylenella sp.]
MRIGIRLALSIFALGAIAISAGAVHSLWTRTAEANSRALVETINAQIVAAVQKEVEQIAAQARAAHGAIRTLFFQNVLDSREADKREFVFLSQLQAQSTVSRIVFGWPNGDFFSARKLGDEEIEMSEIADMEGKRQRRLDRYTVVVGDIQFEERRFEPSEFESTGQPWYRAGFDLTVPRWTYVTDHPDGVHPALAYAGPVQVYVTKVGVLAIMVQYERFSRLLSGLAVGMTGSAFILSGKDGVIAVPDAEADETHPADLAGHPLLPIAEGALAHALEGPDMGQDETMSMRHVVGGDAYAVTLTPLGFSDWMLATVIPEAEFLGPIEATTRRLAIGLAIALLVFAGLSVWLGRKLIAAPLATVAAELKHVERFELTEVRRHASRLTEINALSDAIARMASGLSAFGKYLPADLVRTLVAEGIEARPGGSNREISVLFADIAGFTGLSERLGDKIVPLLGSYLDLLSRTIGEHRGTVDKFIGDAVMAFWGAPAENSDHAFAACRAGLACAAALQEAGLVDERGRPLRMRIGLNSGTALVGNIGSDTRLNYTAIGDTVNIASRLEGANKVYGTDIIIGEATRKEAGARIVVRELDRIAVYGRVEGIAIFELLGLAGESPVPEWAPAYELGLEKYRARDFAAAVERFEAVIALKGRDEASSVMIERCRDFLRLPPTSDWTGTTALAMK